MKNCLISILVLTSAFQLISCNDAKKEEPTTVSFDETNIIFSDIIPAVTDSFSIEVPANVVVQKNSGSASNSVYALYDPSGKKMMSVYIGASPLTLNRFGKIHPSRPGTLYSVGKKEITPNNKPPRMIHMLSLSSKSTQTFMEFNYSKDYAYTEVVEKIISSAKFIYKQD